MTDDRLRDALAGMQPSVDAGTVESALGDLHHRSARRRRSRRVLGGFASIAVLAGALAIVAALGPGGDDAQQVIADQPDTTTNSTETTTTVEPAPETTSTTAETTTTTEAPPVSELDDLALGVVGLELSTWHFGEVEYWNGLWRADDDLAERVAADLLQPGEPADTTIHDRATMRFELVDGSVVFVEVDLESGWVDPGGSLDRGLVHELRAGLDDAVSSPWEPVDLDDTEGEYLARVVSHTTPPFDSPEVALSELLDAFEAERFAGYERFLGEVILDGSDPQAVIRWRGLGDDSARGVDYRITLSSAGQGFEVGTAESRWLCGRGVPGPPDYLCI